MFLSIAHMYFSHDATTNWQLGEVMRAGVCVNVNANTGDGAAGGRCGRRRAGCDG